MSARYASKEMISVEMARETVLRLVNTMPSERVGLASCVGRVLARDVASDIDIAAFDNSAMDGFAVRFEDVKDASLEAPVTLRIVGYIGAGAVYEGRVEQGQAVRIMTGAPIPDGADAVIKIESTEILGEDDGVPAGIEIRISKAFQLGENIRPRGEDAKVGEVLLHSGDTIMPATVGLLAATGNAEVAVFSRPRVAIFSTGSELVSATEFPGPGQIRDSNSFTLAAAASDAGAIVTMLPCIEDTREALCATLMELVRDHDFVVLSGGAAEGDFDYTTACIRELGEIVFNKVCMRPGKAQTLGIIDGVPIFGLPGNPAAAVVGFEVLVRPALRKMQGYTSLSRPVATARVTKDIKKKEPRRIYLRSKLERNADGALIVTPASNQSSALLSTFCESNCLLVVPEGDAPVQAGDEVQCLCINLPEGEVI